MVIESRRRLNQRLCQNWIEQNRKLEASGRSSSAASSNLDECDLTSLSWLIELDMDCLSAPLHPSAKSGLVGKHPSATSGLADPSKQDGDLRERLRKPTHTYSAMITRAINETAEKQITVAGIYNWIRSNFPYYRETTASWKNSVRHCLSTNRRFQRVTQTRDKFGKRFWRIVPDPRPGDPTTTTGPIGARSSAPRPPPHRLLVKRGVTPMGDCNISEAIRCIGRWETIDSTGESQGSDSTRDSSVDDESSAESLGAESIRTDLSYSSPQPPPSSGLFNPDWSCDSRLNEILRDLNDLESDDKSAVVAVDPGFESTSFEQAESHFPHRQRLENDCLLTNLNELNSTVAAEDWSLADLTQLSSCKPISDYLPNSSCIDDLSSYLLLDADLGFRTIL